MIKNIIFDIGNVLAAFRWQKLFKELGFCGDVFDRVADATVLGPWWPEYDRSRIPDGQIWENCCALAPGYEKEVMAVFENIEGICREYDYARPWLYQLKAAGYNIYLLSNFGRTSFEIASKNFSFMDLVDGQVISYEVEEIKPDRGIFSALEEKYGIHPEESVFLDDSMKNVKAAKSYGYHSIYFENQALAKKKLEGMGVFSLDVSEEEDQKFMKEAIKQAKKAAAMGEVPIGCVIVRDGRIISRGYNQRNKKHSTLGHAGDFRHWEGVKGFGGLAPGRLYSLCDSGTLFHVRRGYDPGKAWTGCHWSHEPQGRLCRFCDKYAVYGRL